MRGDVAEEPQDSRLVAPLLLQVRELGGTPGYDSRIVPAPGQEMPATEPSSLTTVLYKKMEEVLQSSSAKAMVIPYMQRGATDGSFLRQKGMAVYGVPLFLREDQVSRAHGNDERISVHSLEAGTKLLWEITLAVAR